jgi:hypothetical protein
MPKDESRGSNAIASTSVRNSSGVSSGMPETRSDVRRAQANAENLRLKLAGFRGSDDALQVSDRVAEDGVDRLLRQQAGGHHLPGPFRITCSGLNPT